MMKLKALILSAALGGAAMFGVQSAANATTITFEGGTPGAQIGTTYTGEGATFYGGVYEQCGGGCPAPADGIFASGAGEVTPFEVLFTDVQKSVSFYNVTNSSLVATAYNAAGQAVSSLSSTTGGTIADIMLAGPGISFVTFSFLPGKGDFGFGIDDLTFAGVPEPSIWAFMILGLAMVGATLRRGFKRDERAGVAA